MTGDRKGEFNLIPYTEKWRHLFAEERVRLRQVFDSSSVAIHHIGSTSVVGLVARPIIDTCVEFPNMQLACENIGAVVRLGYEWSQCESTDERYFLRKGNPTQYQLSLTPAGSWYVRRTTAFRDYLNKHHEEMIAYAQLKNELYEKDPVCGREYTNGKTQCVSRILNLAKCSKT